MVAKHCQINGSGHKLSHAEFGEDNVCVCVCVYVVSVIMSISFDPNFTSLCRNGLLSLQRML